jgi:hypothetical protein
MYSIVLDHTLAYCCRRPVYESTTTNTRRPIPSCPVVFRLILSGRVFTLILLFILILLLPLMRLVSCA